MLKARSRRRSKLQVTGLNRQTKNPDTCRVLCSQAARNLNSPQVRPPAVRRLLLCAWARRRGAYNRNCAHINFPLHSRDHRALVTFALFHACRSPRARLFFLSYIRGIGKRSAAQACNRPSTAPRVVPSFSPTFAPKDPPLPAAAAAIPLQRPKLPDIRRIFLTRRPLPSAPILAIPAAHATTKHLPQNHHDAAVKRLAEAGVDAACAVQSNRRHQGCGRDRSRDKARKPRFVASLFLPCCHGRKMFVSSRGACATAADDSNAQATDFNEDAAKMNAHHSPPHFAY